MIEISQHKLACVLFTAVWLSSNIRAEVALEDAEASRIVWGEHWAGPEMTNAKGLEGKVVLLKIWGGCDPCREIAPGTVALARRHKDAPLHVIASYSQSEEKDPVVAFLKSVGWDEAMDNFSVMHQTHYSPEVEVTGLPFYLLFDHTGKLRYHHVAGTDPGGNGELYQKQVAELLEEATARKPCEPLTDLRAWANTQGQLIEASLLGVRGGRARFQMKNGRTYEYPLEKLSEKARREIEELVEK